MAATAVLLTPGSYFQLALLAGTDLAIALPDPFLFDRVIPSLPIPVSVGVYVAFDQSWRAVYVGSVTRPANPRGLEARVNEHLREHRKSFSWRGAWVLPLRPTMSHAEVRRLEGRIGRLLRPSMSRRLPS
jgi:hypothetical protein